MKRAVLAVDPTTFTNSWTQKVFNLVGYFQDHGLFTQLDIVSVIHPNLYILPTSGYRKLESKLLKEAHASLQSQLKEQLNFQKVRVIASDSTFPEDNVRIISDMTRRLKAEVLIVGGSGRQGLAYWMLGSFSETATLSATVPVLLLKQQIDVTRFRKNPVIVLSVDIEYPPRRKVLKSVGELAMRLKASTHVLYVLPKSRLIHKVFEKPEDLPNLVSAHQKLKTQLQSHQIKPRFVIKNESKTIAHTINEYAESQHAWAIVLTPSNRGRMHKIMLGSTARRTLALSKLPLLVLKDTNR
jgi:nucleotide-binding universal stress UspA family protein